VATIKFKYPTEDQEQINFCEYLEALKVRFFAVPNGMYIGKDEKDEENNARFAYLAKMKKMGFKKGVLDLVILSTTKSGRYNILFLEMKKVEGGKVSDAQQEWIDWLHANHHAVAVAKGCDAAIRIFNKYLAM
jgi:hypothetical protein